MKRLAGALLREPSLWFFLVAGSALAVWHAVAPEHDTLVVTSQDVAQLERAFAEHWGRPPTDSERQALVNDFVRDELLWREGQRLGLDRSDPIVRRRVVQKMTFLLEAAASASPPTEDDLQRFFHEHAERYRLPERVSFAHVFWPRPADAPSAALPPTDNRWLSLRERLEAGEAPERVSTPFLRGLYWRERAVDDVESTFGPEFVSALRRLAPGVWSDPISSRLGWHLVRLEQWYPPSLPPFDAVRARVEQDWIEARRAQAREEGLRNLKQRYKVLVDGKARP